ncbi:MAG: GspH/FimT family pseudopilin [Gemmatimonadota bacterium]
MHRGVTLPELLLALVLAGLLALLSVPPLAALRDRARVRSETIRLVATLDLARGAAIRLGSGVRVGLSDSVYQFTTSPIAGAPESWRLPGTATGGVLLSGAGAPIQFGAHGLAVGVSNRTLVLSRGSVTRRIVISRLGRLTW